MTEQPELSPTDWVREQTQRILEQGTTEGVEVFDRPVVLFTTTGVKSGQKRYVPLMRVEENGRYAMVASKGGDPKAPGWYHNLKAHPDIEVNVGPQRVPVTAKPVLPDDPDYARMWDKVNEQNSNRYNGYQKRTTRPIPIVRLTPRSSGS